ncbi:MAG: metallophosphoesterase family protein [Limisphaerales bacterium]
MHLGLISDTHDFLDPRVAELLAGVEHIVHAGDIGSAWILHQLEQIAPVTAVLGNTDSQLTLPLTHVVTFAEHKLLVQHIVNPAAPDDALRRRLAREKPAAVIFGHTHKALDQVNGGVRYINPGYAGKPRFNQPRSLARLQLTAAGMTVEFIPLQD